MQVLDLERNILQAKGLRTAICVRIVHTKSQNETVIYVLRVEDVESGLQWVVHRRFRDFFALNDELLDMSHFAKEAEFPRKRISIRNTNKLVEIWIWRLWNENCRGFGCCERSRIRISNWINRIWVEKYGEIVASSFP